MKTQRLLCLALLLLTGACSQMPVVSRDTPVVAEQADLQRRSQIRMELATAYYGEAQFGLALQELDKALAMSPQNAEAYGLRGLVLAQLGEDKEAERSLHVALRLDPDNPALQNNMGWFLCHGGRFAQGLPYFEQALASRRYASPAKALINAGLCSLQAGQATKAERYLLRALEAEPDAMLAHASLAKLFYSRADYRLARLHILPVVNREVIPVDQLMMAIRIERKLGDRAAEQSLAARLKRQFPEAPETMHYLRGDMDE